MVPKRASDAALSEIVDEQVQNTIAEIVGDDKEVKIAMMSEIGDDDEQVQNDATTSEEPANMYAGFEMSENNGMTNIVPKLRSAARMKDN